MKPGRDVLRLSAGLQERVQHIRRERRQHPAAARQERVRLKEVRNTTPFLGECGPRIVPRLDVVTLEDDRLVTGPRDSQRGSQPGDSSARNEESHSATLR